MNAEQFLSAITRKVGTVSPQGYAKEWTAGMYRVLYEVGTEAGFYVHCKPFDCNGQWVGDREIHDIDFMYFPRQFDADGYIYYQPTIAIEHENNWDYNSKRDDFWKLCLLISPLRVFIGYCKTESEAKCQAKQLAEFYLTHQMKQLPEGETAILISWDQIAGLEWVARSLRGQEPEWREIVPRVGVASPAPGEVSGAKGAL